MKLMRRWQLWKQSRRRLGGRRHEQHSQANRPREESCRFITVDPERGNTRQSERVIQLRVRQRLTHVIRRLIQNEGGWKCLPRGQKDLAILS